MRSEEEKPVNLKRHQQYKFISPKYLIRVFLTLIAMVFLVYLAFDLFDSRKSIEKTKTPSSDSISSDIQIEIDTLE